MNSLLIPVSSRPWHRSPGELHPRPSREKARTTKPWARRTLGDRSDREARFPCAVRYSSCIYVRQTAWRPASWRSCPYARGSDTTMATGQPTSCRKCDETRRRQTLLSRAGQASRTTHHCLPQPPHTPLAPRLDLGVTRAGQPCPHNRPERARWDCSPSTTQSPSRRRLTPPAATKSGTARTTPACQPGYRGYGRTSTTS